MRQALFCLKTSKRIFFSFPFRWKDKIRDLAISPSFKLYNKRQKKMVFSSDINERCISIVGIIRYLFTANFPQFQTADFEEKS